MILNVITLNKVNDNETNVISLKTVCYIKYNTKRYEINK